MPISGTFRIYLPRRHVRPEDLFMEMLKIVAAETGTPTGTCLPRHEALAFQEWCCSTNIFVLDQSGRILCHQRSTRKERLPGVWMTHLGGHVGADETYESNALKELAEESGVSVGADALIAWRTTRMLAPRLWTREFVTVIDADTALIPQPDEVDRFRWMTPEEVLHASEKQPDAWCAGTHDFHSDYQCLRAAVAAVAATNERTTRMPEYRLFAALAA